MKYLVMIQNNAAVSDLFGAMTDDERAAAFQVYWDVETDLTASGELVDSKAVEEEKQFAVRRTDEGAVASPVAAGATFVTGYYLVDVTDADRAFEIGARFPEAAVDDGIRVARVLTQEDFDAMT